MRNTRLLLPLKIIRPLKILGVLYVSYLILLMLVAMPALNLLAPKFYRDATGRELQLDKMIVLNPFTLSATVRGARSDNPDRKPFWSFDRLRIDISLASLWRRHLVLDALQLDGLALQITQTAADRYNFSDILDRQTSPSNKTAQPTTTHSSLPISIAQIAINARHLGLRAPYLSAPLTTDINDVRIALANFSTAAAEPSSTSATTLHGDTIALDIDTIAAQFLRADKPFAVQLHKLQLALPEFSSNSMTAQRYTLTALDHSGGSVQLDGQLSVAAQQSSGTLRLHNFDLLPAWRYLSNKLAFEAQRALLDSELHYAVNWSAPLRYRIDNSTLTLHDLQLQSRADADTGAAIAVVRIEGIQIDSLQPSAQIANIVVDAPQLRGWNRDAKVSLLDMLYFPSSAETDASSPWRIQIDALAVQNGRIDWRANQLDNRQLTIAPLQLQITNVHWPDPAPLQLDLETAINTDTKVSIKGNLIPGDLTGKFSCDIEGLPLTWGNTLLGQQLSAQLQSGSASAHIEFALDKGKPTTLHSDGHIDGFELQRLPDQQKLLAWQQLQWQKLSVDFTKRALQLEQITATKPWLQFRINADRTNNFQKLLIDRSTANPVNTATTKPTAKTSATKTAANDKQPWHFAVHSIRSDNGLLDFRDSSLTKPFHVTVAEFNGAIEGLSDSAPAKIAFKGTVDGYAPVALTGSANLFATIPALNITLDVANLDLATLTPYSGTYAGYLINGGRLSVQLAYTLENNRVKGSNHIVVNQLELGAPVSGPKVMDLPLRLAIYLLTDADGVMDLGVDVTGNVDDPDFSVSSIIWKAFRNVIVKTATSPFSALAKLAGSSDQDFDRIEFSAGSDQLATNSNDKLSSLSGALQKKSALRLNITGHVAPSHDLEGLHDSVLSEQLIKTAGIDNSDIAQQSPRWQKAVAELYKKRFPADSSGKLVTMQMNDAMRDNIELPPRALDDLATRRAVTVKQTLVIEHGLAADRIAIAPVDLGTDKLPGLHATLAIE